MMMTIDQPQPRMFSFPSLHLFLWFGDGNDDEDDDEEGGGWAAGASDGRGVLKIRGFAWIGQDYSSTVQYPSTGLARITRAAPSRLPAILLQPCLQA